MDRNKYTKKDAAKDTDSSSKKVSHAWHDAREDAQQSDHPVDKELTKDWERTPDTPVDKEDSDSKPDNRSK
jgi:hypothetical protein